MPIDRLHLLLALPGSLPPALAARLGDFDAWFERALADEPVDWTKAWLFRDAPLPDPREFDGLVVAGSLASLARPAPWMERACSWLRGAVEADAPVLGVCFGHQMLGRAFGATVAPNPRGPEFGTAVVELSEEGRVDPLFAGLPGEIEVQATHEDAVLAPPQGARLLGFNEATEVQAIAVGERARGVQFHPEMGLAQAAALCEGHPGSSVRPTPAGAAILRNFAFGIAAKAAR